MKMTNQPIHYSGLIFYKAVMIDGNSLMPSPYENGYEEGH